MGAGYGRGLCVSVVLVATFGASDDWLLLDPGTATTVPARLQCNKGPFVPTDVTGVHSIRRF